MSKVEWFRRTTWTDRDRDEFNARLKRSRGDSNKSQYLRIQAVHLAEAGLPAAAIELLDRLLTEFPDKMGLASAHLQKAECLASLGQTEPAIHEFRAALRTERGFPNVQTNAWLDFGWFVVENQLTDLYGEALEVLEEFRDEEDLTFPFQEYRYLSVRCIIADFLGDRTTAREFAIRALAEASKEHSGFRYHAKVGLVGRQPKAMEQKLKAFAKITSADENAIPKSPKP